jgi:chromosomal replication initiation ATPase DnaA
MSSQLKLKFTERATYSSEKFVAHTGVQAASSAIVTLAAQSRFTLLYIHGPSLSGKTHLSVYCAGLINSLKRSVEIVSFDEISEWHTRSIRRKASALRLAGGSIIFDDADKWLVDTQLEGTFTAITDAVQKNKGILVLFGSQPIEHLELRPQIASRLVAGAQINIQAPADYELDQVLDAVLKQRGLRLSVAKRRFILSRITRTIPEMVGYVDRLCQSGLSKRSITSFEVLGAALL